MPQPLSPALRHPTAIVHAARPLRVLLVLTGLSMDGGAEVQTVQLAVRLKRRGWDVAVASLLHVDTIPAALVEANIPVECVDLSRGVGALSGLLRLASVFRRRQPHIVHCHMTHAVLASRFARLRSNVPVLIGTLHGLHMYNVSGGGHLLRERLHRATDGLSDLTTVVCRAALEYYSETKAAPAEKLRLVENGVDTERFRPDPETRARKRAELGLGGEFVWLCVARLDPVKDHHTLLRAYAKLGSTQRNSVLMLAGDGANKDDLAAEAARLGIEDRVRFLGAREDVAELWAAADACVLSSRFEALPLTLLEAGASGLPAVATNVGGCADIVVEGKTGYLASAKDPQSLADAMSKLERLPELDRLCLGTAARQHVTARYGLEAIVTQWESLYNELAGQVAEVAKVAKR